MKKVVFLLFSVVLFASCVNETAAPVEKAVDTTAVVVDSTVVEVEEVDSMVEVARKLGDYIERSEQYFQNQSKQSTQ